MLIFTKIMGKNILELNIVYIGIIVPKKLRLQLIQMETEGAREKKI